jgi:hypothetical protein
MFSVVMVGQILTGLAQPFVLAAPTRYSDMWFTEDGRIGATALASLANPFGAAVCIHAKAKKEQPLKDDVACVSNQSFLGRRADYSVDSILHSNRGMHTSMSSLPFVCCLPKI